MDRGFEARGTPEQVWPWLVQLGKGRGGWYFPRLVERFVPRSRRAARTVQPQWQGLEVGDVIPDYGGPQGFFEAGGGGDPRPPGFPPPPGPGGPPRGGSPPP